MKRAALIVALLAALAGGCWLFPLFHVVRLEQAAKEKSAAAFDPKQFAEEFWNKRLIESLDEAAKLEVLLPAIQRDPSEARKKLSRSLGLSESYIYFVSGKGRVLAVSDDGISLAVTEAATTPDVTLHIGLLFGNAIRDGTGLLKVSDYPNSQDFNGIAEELNRIIEARVLPKLREQAKVGTKVRFVGCAEVNDESTDLKPLRVVPIQAEVE